MTCVHDVLSECSDTEWTNGGLKTDTGTEGTTGGLKTEGQASPASESVSALPLCDVGHEMQRCPLFAAQDVQQVVLSASDVLCE